MTIGEFRMMIAVVSGVSLAAGFVIGEAWAKRRYNADLESRQRQTVVLTKPVNGDFKGSNGVVIGNHIYNAEPIDNAADGAIAGNNFHDNVVDGVATGIWIGKVPETTWRSTRSAPRDGTVVEMMETRGVAPWYGIFKWKPGWGWMSAENEHDGVLEDDHLYWRPYHGKGKYVDPTHGAQETVAYWCTEMHMRYDKKKNQCVEP